MILFSPKWLLSASPYSIPLRSHLLHKRISKVSIETQPFPGILKPIPKTTTATNNSFPIKFTYLPLHPQTCFMFNTQLSVIGLERNRSSNLISWNLLCGYSSEGVHVFWRGLIIKKVFLKINWNMLPWNFHLFYPGPSSTMTLQGTHLTFLMHDSLLDIWKLPCFPKSFLSLHKCMCLYS